MARRMDYNKVTPEAMNIMMSMDTYIKLTEIDPALIELIKIRVSQVNGCAFYLNLHTAEGRKMGETEQRIYCVSVWEECTFYTEEEKAALELAEHVTMVSNMRVPDSLYNHIRRYYGEKDYADLVFMINQINIWNRLSIAMGNEVNLK
ncbi:carboxymuconolactone decarboxylase family protein [Paenibacillus agaridevorans]|uniref:carboxymuconolactone decarboxylase family protein n=1 Tax=Paenibacillus agaridevorans TaxID=171404 RepID=UPI001BE4869F|nr:carboxymuconolactone decarboxylase family protein [Paenibacillus agaridevorans]